MYLKIKIKISHMSTVFMSKTGCYSKYVSLTLGLTQMTWFHHDELFKMK